MSILLSLSLLFQAAPIPRIISVEELAGRLTDPKLVIFQIGDTRSKEVYDAGHIPGSQFLSPFSDLAAPRGGPDALLLEIPATAQLDSVLPTRGVSSDSWIVLVSAAEYFSPTTRAAMTLEYAGLGGRVALLDGGLEAWKAAGKPVTTDVPTPTRGNFKTSPDRSVLATIDDLAGNLENPKVAILDARAAAFYNGADTRQGRNGHVPGAKNVPFTSMIGEDGKFKDKAELAAIFEAAGAKPGNRVITYCHIGQQATLVWFVAKYLGYDARLYDGSFQEWAKRTGLPVVARSGN